MQLLSIMQQEARLIDFLKEDLTSFSDEEAVQQHVLFILAVKSTSRLRNAFSHPHRR